MNFIARQPNGLLCRHSSVVDCITHYNMTDEDYIEMCVENAREEAREVLQSHVRDFDAVIRCFAPNNMTQEEFNKVLNEMKLPAEQANNRLT